MPSVRVVTGRSILLTLAGCAVFVGGCAGSKKATPILEDVPFEIDAWRYVGRSGHRVTSEHYEIYTTLGDEVLLASLPQAMETAYLFYRQLVPTAREPQQRMPVYLFARRGEWADFTRRFAGPRAKTLLKVRRGGYTERGVSVIEYVTHSITFPLVAHEGLHQYLHHCVNRRVPAWLNEGLAVLCEGQRWGNIGLKEFDPWHNPSRRNVLAEAPLRNEIRPLDELLRINAGHIVGETTRKIGTYYAQLWALMLFLQEGQEGKYAEGFARLCNALGSQELEPFARAAYVKSTQRTYNFGRELFCNFISDDLETVEREYVAFMRQKILGERQDR
ncbi:MAG: hypothetical protein ACE5I3_04380 [Phycisphaerae bacterium]